MPGYWVTVALIEKMGRLRIQYLGFSVLTVIFVILSTAYHQILATSVTVRFVGFFIIY